MIAGALENQANAGTRFLLELKGTSGGKSGTYLHC